MADVEEFIDDVLQHAFYDPLKRRAYYLKNRVLKGRKKAKSPGEIADRKSSAERTDNAYVAKAKYLKARKELIRVEAMYDKMREDYSKVPLTDFKKQWKYGKIEDKIRKALKKAKKNLVKADKEYAQAFRNSPKKSRKTKNGEYFITRPSR